MSRRTVTLVVIEYGASWPRWLAPTDLGDVAVVAQHYESDAGSLVRQVASRVTRVETAGWTVGSIVLVLSERADPAAQASRTVLARGLMAHLHARAGTKLSISGSSGGSAGRAAGLLVSLLRPDADAARIDLELVLGSGAPPARRADVTPAASSRGTSAG